MVRTLMSDFIAALPERSPLFGNFFVDNIIACLLPKMEGGGGREEVKSNLYNLYSERGAPLRGKPLRFGIGFPSPIIDVIMPLDF